MEEGFVMRMLSDSSLVLGEARTTEAILGELKEIRKRCEPTKVLLLVTVAIKDVSENVLLFASTVSGRFR
jgi:hypothetical protein